MADGPLLLDGRVAIVTGAARGIGAAIARTLHDQGAAVVIADSGTGIDGQGADPAPARALAAELGPRAAAFTESVASPSAAAALVEKAVATFGALDIVVNNAAILRDGFIFKQDPGDFEAVLRNNLFGAWYLLNAATPRMRDQGKAGRAPGSLLNIISTAGLYGNFGQAAYASAKAGLVGLTRVVALDLQRAGITCNALAPFAATRVTDTIRPANPAQETYKTRAMKLDPRHVATVAGWLVSPLAATVSGQVFAVRGREVFLFNQSRPERRLASAHEDWRIQSLADAADAAFADGYTALETDLEAFSSEPLI
ncbi:SDR family oxidoreductase [Oceanibacterium hippocampi]|uniref:Putative short-chain type dehydrogenase/reductase n=1 Tax=Oceanibacterium hippocampi TaxID=745714 RepID=A0A1Y5RHI6_9PROT|nr:SDR family oxidoreductase [Oceanibacterium hippocampi]SLN16458.1 Putative short-chain type dehydrogenase/reductase [Oceanibacterium hippocampi]